MELCLIVVKIIIYFFIGGIILWPLLSHLQPFPGLGLES